MSKLALGFAVTMHSLSGDWNEKHPSVQFQEDYYVAGYYRNSEDRDSFYGGLRGEDSGFFIEGGFVTGYKSMDIMPFFRGGKDIRLSNSLIVEGFVAPSISYDRDIGVVVGIGLKTFIWE